MLPLGSGNKVQAQPDMLWRKPLFLQILGILELAEVPAYTTPLSAGYNILIATFPFRRCIHLVQRRMYVVKMATHIKKAMMMFHHI